MAAAILTNLTDADFTYDINNDVLIIDFSVDLNITGEVFYKSIQKQILDEHSFYETHAKCSFEYDGECCPYKEKAEKYDACGNLINQVNELLQENKTLKELLDIKEAQLLGYNNFKEKLDDIKKFEEHVLYPTEHDKEIRAILEKKYE